MYIILTSVEEFTSNNTTFENKSNLPTLDITAFRHLRNKITRHTNPVVIIDHGQTAQLALLNGIRSSPSLPTPMPADYRNPLPAEAGGGTYGNDGDYDARKWGYEDANATLSPEDFNYLSSKLTQTPLELWSDSRVMHGEAIKSLVEKCMEEKHKLDELRRQEYLVCLRACKEVTICACHIPDCTICGDCKITELIGELISCEEPEVVADDYTTRECAPCPPNKITLNPTSE